MLLNIVGLDPSMCNWASVRGTLDLNSLEVKIFDIHTASTESSSVKQTRKSSDDLRRSRELSKSLDERIAKADMVFVEVPVGSKSARAMASYGICIGVLGQIDEEAVPVIELTPLNIKMASVGTKTASKESIIKWAYEKFPDLDWKRKRGSDELHGDNEHAADAIAAVFAGLQSLQFKELRTMLLSFNK